MKIEIIFRKALLVAIVATLIVSTATAATTTVYASHSDKKTGKSSIPPITFPSGKSSDNSHSSSDQSSSKSNPQQPTTLAGGSDNNPAPSTSTTPSGKNEGPTGATPKCTGDTIESCPIPPGEDLGTNCPSGATVVNGRCTVQGNPFPVHCPSGVTVFGLNTKCPPPPSDCKDGSIVTFFNNCHLQKDCFKVPFGVDTSRIVCIHSRTVVHNTHTTIIQQVPTATSPNDVNLMIVTTCTADQNNGVLSGNLAALCDSTITMMHNDGLDAQLPQVDMYLKARGLLQ